MLLHSREGSREHRPADINSLLDESLNLAYHGARAERAGFTITLERDFDAVPVVIDGLVGPSVRVHLPLKSVLLWVPLGAEDGVLGVLDSGHELLARAIFVGG